MNTSLTRIACAVSLVLASGIASATFFGEDNSVNNDNRNTNSNVNSNRNTNLNSNRQGQAQGQAQGQLQGQAQGQAMKQSQSARAVSEGSTASSSSGGNSQSMTYNEAAIPTITKSYIEHKGTQRIANTPDVGVFAPAPTAPCIVTWGAGGSGPGLGLGLSGWKEDEGCTVREMRRIGADNPAIVRAADEYILEDIAIKRTKQLRRKEGFWARQSSPTGY